MPRLHVDGRPVLEVGEASIGSTTAHGVELRWFRGSLEPRWGPLVMTVTLTTQRVVLTATPGSPADAPWSTPGTVPIELRAIEPSQERRRVTPVRLAGHVRWNDVRRVQTEGSLVLVTMPASLDPESILALRVASDLAHRFLAIARAGFVAARRSLCVDRPDLVEALPAS